MNKSKLIIIILALTGLLAYSCQDDWDKHYDRSESLPAVTETLYDLLKQDASLSKFTQLVKIAGCDTMLSSTETYTVWAPVNEALDEVDLNTITKEEAELIVKNHFARFNNSTSIPMGKWVRMKNLKIYSYSENGTVFGGAPILTHDVLAGNGLLHTIATSIPFHYNIFEYIAVAPEMSKLSHFLNSFNEEIFDPELSTPIDIDKNGRTIYDSVKVMYNRLLDDRFYGLGAINTEDSIYTMLAADNQAWDAAYARISPYFKVYNKDAAKSDSIQRVQTSLAIVNDLIYRGRIFDPASKDSLRSTGRSTMHNPANLFSGSTQTTASNGLIYSTDHVRYDNTETWNKQIQVECEYNVGRTYSVNSVGTAWMIEGNLPFLVSGGIFLEVKATSASANPGVTFTIPRVLSGKYNIYIDCLPGAIDGMPKDSTKLLFDLTYIGTNGKPASKTVDSNSLLTSGTRHVRLQIFKEFEFPYSNYYDRLWEIDLAKGLHRLDEQEYSTKLLVKTNVNAQDFNKGVFSRTIRIDRIIFEPVPNN